MITIHSEMIIVQNYEELSEICYCSHAMRTVTEIYF